MRPVAPDTRHWKLQLAEGVVLVSLGFVAAFVPFRLGMTLFVWLFLIGGLTGLVTTLLMWGTTGFWWSLLSAIVAIAAGIAVLALPLFAVLGFSFLLMTFLVLEGIVTVMFAVEHWRDLSGRWGWMLASGIVDLSLAAFIVIGLPATADWTFGLILAVNLIFGGGALIGMALAARQQSEDA
ncbi:MAG: DUF308 domain-containing protein [Xanthobacteraceae bacterium]|jgi:uncharacterized membrane protein HdeD (DUF308 family)